MGLGSKFSPSPPNKAAIVVAAAAAKTAVG